MLLFRVFVNSLHVFRNIANLFYISYDAPLVPMLAKTWLTDTVHLKNKITSHELRIIFSITVLCLLFGLNREVKNFKSLKNFFFSWFVWSFCLLNRKVLQIFLMTWGLVPDWNLLCMSSWISVIIFKYRLLNSASLFILFLTLNLGIWINFFIYWYHFHVTQV